MSCCHDVFMINDSGTAIEFALVREHGHPRVLVYICGRTSDNSVFFPQSSASLNATNYNHIRISNCFFYLVYHNNKYPYCMADMYSGQLV